MHIRRLPAEEAAVRRYVEELWVPYNREFEGIVEEFALAANVDLVAEELDYRLDRLESGDLHTWVAVDSPDDDGDLAAFEGAFAGYVTTTLDESPSVFDRPDRLLVNDIYVREPYRGTGLARELVDRARTRAREEGCTELTLNVDVENGRAIAFYEKLGFETRRFTMRTGVDDSLG